MSQSIGWIEQLAIRLGLIPDAPPHPEAAAPGPLVAAAPPEQWDDWVEIEPRGWPGTPDRKALSTRADDVLQLRIGVRPARLRRQRDERDSQVRRATRCIRRAAAGCVRKGRRRSIRSTIPDRILYPLKRVGQRGDGKWERIDWQEAVQMIASAHSQSARREAPQRSRLSRRPAGQ